MNDRQRAEQIGLDAIPPMGAVPGKISAMFSKNVERLVLQALKEVREEAYDQGLENGHDAGYDAATLPEQLHKRDRNTRNEALEQAARVVLELKSDRSVRMGVGLKHTKDKVLGRAAEEIRKLKK